MSSYLHEQITALVGRDSLPEFGKRKLGRALELLGDDTVDVRNMAGAMQSEIHMCLVAAQGSALTRLNRPLADDIEALRLQVFGQFMRQQEEAIRGEPERELTDALAFLEIHPELRNDPGWVELTHELEAKVAARN